MSGKTYTQQMQNLVDEYRREGGRWPAAVREIAGWAIRTDRWQPSRVHRLALR